MIGDMFIPDDLYFSVGTWMVMNKNKKIIGIFGVCAVAGAGYAILRKVWKGSSYLQQFADKVDTIPSEVEVKLDDDGYYSLTKKNNHPFKILQLTDLHIGGGYLSRYEDMQALKIVYQSIHQTKPDLIVITGDLVCSKAHISFSKNNLNSIKIISDILEKIGIPYAITFGNHDSEVKATHRRRALAEYLMSQEKCLMVETKETENITGFSNYLVKLNNADHSLNSIIYMLDSNEYLQKDKRKTYDYIHDDQVEWYKNQVERFNREQNRTIPSFIYIHIPVKEYDDAWKATINANKEAIYFYGSKDENVSCSKIDSKLFDTALALGSTKGIFCGHDHLNDYSVEYKGIRLTYGLSIDCILYAKNLSEHKGATLLKIMNDETFHIRAIKHRRK